MLCGDGNRLRLSHAPLPILGRGHAGNFSARIAVKRSECEPFARFPDGDAADLELLPICQRCGEPSAFPRLVGKMASASRCRPNGAGARRLVHHLGAHPIER